MSEAFGSRGWIEARLRGALGEGARLRELVVEGTTCRVEGLEAPLGGSARLFVDRAEIELGAGPTLLSLGLPLPLALALSSLEGRLVLGERAIPFGFMRRDGAASAWVAGTLTLGALELDLRVAPASPGHVAVRLDRGTARIEGSLKLPSANRSGATPLAVVAMSGVDAELARAVMDLAGGALAMPADLSANLEIVIAFDRAVDVAAELATGASSLRAVVRVQPGASVDAELSGTLRGRLAPADLVFAPRLVEALRGTHPLAIDARVGGRVRRPTLAGRVATELLVVRIGDHGEIGFDDASAVLDVGPAALTWTGLRAGLARGRIQSRGRLAWATRELEARVTASAVAVESLPLLSREDPWVTGALSADVELCRSGGSLSGSAQARIDDAVFPALGSLAPRLRALGLPPVVARAVGPAVARAHLAHGELRIDGLRVALPSARLEAGATIDLTARRRRAEARGELVIASSYLARSPLLALPAKLADEIVVPFEVRSELGAVQVEARIAEAIESLLRERFHVKRRAPQSGGS